MGQWGTGVQCLLYTCFHCLGMVLSVLGERRPDVRLTRHEHSHIKNLRRALLDQIHSSSGPVLCLQQWTARCFQAGTAAAVTPIHPPQPAFVEILLGTWRFCSAVMRTNVPLTLRRLLGPDTPLQNTKSGQGFSGPVFSLQHWTARCWW